MHGETGSRLAAESHTAAVDRIEAIVKEEAIDCEFERLDGYLFVPPGESKKVLDDELEAGRRAGLKLEKVDRAPLDSYDTGPALRFPRQAQFHPLKYLAGLAAVIEQSGVGSIPELMPAKLKGATEHSLKRAEVPCYRLVQS